MTIIPLLAVLLCPGPQETALDARVTMSLPAKPLPALAVELGQKTGMKVEAEGALARRAVLVHVTDRPVRDVFEMVALAADARVEYDADKVRFVADPDRRRASSEAALALKVEEGREYLERLLTASRDEYTAANLASALQAETARQELAPESVFNPFTSATALQSLTPVGRAMHRTLRAIGPAATASIRPGTRVVYSTRKTPTQRLFPIPLDRFVADLEADQGVYDAAVKLMRSEEQARHANPMEQADLSAVVAARFVVSNPTMVGIEAVTAQLDLLDAQGRVMLSGQALVRAGSILSMMTMLSGQRKSDMEITWSPEAKQQIKLFMQSGGSSADEGTTSAESSSSAPESPGTAPAEPPNPTGSTQKQERKLPPIEEWVHLFPERWEPLSLAPSEVVQAYARTKGLDVVAWLPESAVVLAALQEVGGLDTSFIDEVLLKGIGRVVAKTPTSIVIGPSDPDEAESTFIDRARLGQFLRALREGPVSVIETQADYLATRGSSTTGLLETLYVGAVEGGDAVGFFAPDGREEALTFLGTLSAAQRQSFGRGARVSISALTEAQRAVLSRLLYGTAGPTLLNRLSPPGRGESLEPTELAPNGLPLKGWVALESKVEPRIGIKSGRGVNWQTLWDLAVQRAQVIRATEGKPVPPDSLLYLSGRHADYTFVLAIDGSYTLRVPFSETRVDRSVPQFTLDQMPSGLRQEFETLVRKALAAPADSEPSEQPLDPGQ